MTEIDDLSARLTALETVIGQLMTHIAVRNDDPTQWVATRRKLALNAVRDEPLPLDHFRERAFVASVQSAIAGLFDQVEDVVADYAHPSLARRGKGTTREVRR